MAKSALIGPAFVLIVFVVQGTFFIRANSQTVDEAMHLAAGYSYLTQKDFRLEPQNPPLMKQLLALPLFLIHSIPFNPDPQHWRERDGYLIGRDFLYKSEIPADHILFLSRLANLFLGATLIVLIGRWAYRLWGNRAAMLAMVLASLEPNFVAHSSLLTTDIGVTLFIFLALYHFWEYLNSPRWWVLVTTGISIGMALLSKYSAILLIPTLAFIVALRFSIYRNCYIPLPLKQNEDKPSHKFFQTATVFSFILFLAFLTIPPAYFFQGFEPWLAGFREFHTLAQEGLLAFFLGEYSHQGWWSYFIISFLIKTPIGSLALIFASLALYRSGSPLRARDAVVLLLIVVIFFVVMTQAKISIGVRHILPVYPFLFVLASRLATIRLHRRWLAYCLIGIPVLWTAISSLRVAPHQLAYFNEFVGGPAQGYRYLSDSNLDWGQDLKGLKAYMERENLPMIYLSYFGTAPPAYYGIRYQYVPGAWPLEWPPPADKVPATAARKILAISVYNLQDVSTAYYPLFRWLWARKPIAKIGYSIFCYDLTNDLEGLAKLEETYIKAGIRRSP
jgi:hypothetical protein